MIRRLLLVLVLLLLLIPSIFAADDVLATELTVRAQTAMSAPDYLVTPGDIYTLAFMAGTKEVEYIFTVDSSYRVRVVNMGVVDASGMTYLELKKKVESIVTANYPLSGVQFALTTPATFTVTVRGEVTATYRTSVWALQRLSQVIKDLTPIASVRDVEVQSTNGHKTSRVYDFFKAERFGDLSQDPYLRPGDIITIKKLSRSITLSGAVNRPGTYQLLEGEGLKDLIHLYGDDLTPLADPSRIELVRYVASASVSGDKLFLDQKAIEENFSLQHLDTVKISSRQDLLPVMYIEGAIGTPTSSTTQVSARVEVRLNAGENYASLVRNNRAQFTSISDIQNAYILRGSERLPLDLSPMLYDSAYRSDYSVQNQDVLVIPFRQFFVTVTGAVMAPGRYAYIPDRKWDYYIALAGGFNKETNAFEAISIKDLSGNKRSKKDMIEPETIIDAKNSTFTYYFNKYAPVVVTTLGIITSYYSVRAIIDAN